MGINIFLSTIEIKGLEANDAIFLGRIREKFFANKNTDQGEIIHIFQNAKKYGLYNTYIS